MIELMFLMFILGLNIVLIAACFTTVRKGLIESAERKRSTNLRTNP